MKGLYTLLVLLYSYNSWAQITSIVPNHARRGVILNTTITPNSNSMGTSSGQASSYDFWLQKGNDIINDGNYATFTNSGLGWATAAHLSFNIPFDATPGSYDLHITEPWGWSVYSNYVLPNAVQIFETMISGQVYFDANQNGILDTNENGISNQSINIIPSNTITHTGYDGYYNAFMDTGTYSTNIVTPVGFTATSPSSIAVTVPPDTSGNNFGLYTPPSSILLHDFYASSDPVRCNRQSKAVWSISSLSNNLQTGSITMIMDTSISYINSTLSPSFIGNDSIRWEYTLQPFQSITNNVTVLGGSAGSAANFYVSDSLFDSTGTFVSVSNDTASNDIICSLDPNDMTATPYGFDSTSHYTLKSETMTYRIRFQNCGNDTAFDISILNWIDPDLDLNTLRILYSSFPAGVQYENNRTVRFMFNNIMLPDSNVDELNSHGMIAYTIKPMANIPDYTTATNNAYIYFDYNPAVVTNLVWNNFVSQYPTTEIIQVDSKQILINPIPVHDYSLLILPDNCEYKLKIFDLSGRQIIDETVSGNYILNSEKFNAGVFFYQLISNSESLYSGKFIVVH